jgi:hypothetical protein
MKAPSGNPSMNIEDDEFDSRNTLLDPFNARSMPVQCPFNARSMYAARPEM